jgi:hypothetical protein
MIEAKTMVTPIGEAVYPRLLKPDTKFNEAGEYKVTLKIKKQDAVTILSDLDKYLNDSLATFEKEAKGKKLKLAPKPYSVEGDFFLVKMKMKASGINKKTKQLFTQRPIVVDAKKNPVPLDTFIDSGSKCKCVFDAIPYNSPMTGAGITLRLKMVQVIELVTRAKVDHLLKEEDGYVTEKVETISNEIPQVQTSADF